MFDSPILFYDRASSMIIVIGGGTDGGGRAIDLKTGKVIPIPGWEAFRLNELLLVAHALETVTRFQNPRLAQAAAAPLAEFVQKELEGVEVGRFSSAE